tara:strand:+ start:2495 stop:3001 length:507 start_codon:yes stop_codon:yes gene_type:complete
MGKSNTSNKLEVVPVSEAKAKTDRKQAQFNLMFRIPNTFEGTAFLKQARHYLNKASYRLQTVATNPIDGKRGMHGDVKRSNAKTLNLYVTFKNGRIRPFGLKNIKALRREVIAQDELVDTLMTEVERLESIVANQRLDITALRSEQDGQTTRLLTAVRNRINAVTSRS